MPFKHSFAQLYFAFNLFYWFPQKKHHKKEEKPKSRLLTRAENTVMSTEQWEKMQRSAEDGVLIETFLLNNFRNVMYAARRGGSHYCSHFMQWDPDGPLPVLLLLFMCALTEEMNYATAVGGRKAESLATDLEFSSSKMEKVWSSVRRRNRA